VLTLERRLALLERAVSGGEIEGVNDQGGQDRARLSLQGTKTVKFAYLDSPDAGGLPLHLYPGDTLEQARVLFSSPSRVQSTLALRGRPWAVEPHFHWGFMTRGLCWTRTSLSTDDYARYWVERIDEAAAIERADWEHELARLINDGVFSPTDRAQFHADFTNTNRQSAVPRPTLKLRRVWPVVEAERDDFPDALRAALIDALTALGESRDPLR
jgi:hypothetical protein